MEDIKKVLQAACENVFNITIEPELSRTSEQFGDYATNVALKLAGQVGKNPREVAEQIKAFLEANEAHVFEKIEVAGPGFINLTMPAGGLVDELDRVLEEQDTYGRSELHAGQTVVAEYSDPNPFKVLHAGHLYTSVVGDAIANLFEAAGAKVHRVNFGGDVGLHVGKTLWAILNKLGGEHPDKLADIPEDKQSEWMAEAYVAGTNAYEDDETAKAKIIELNKQVYRIHAENDQTSPLAQIYWTCREWSYAYFNQFYTRIGSQFEKFYPESSVADLGLQTVKRHIGTVFEESDGAVVFKGEEYGLHTRVFINREGLPTYEAKDVGLIMQKYEDYHFDRSVVITGNEQEQYMAVVLKAVELFAPELANATTHLTHGIVKLAGGVKMSSRKGNILRAVDVLDAAAAANRELTGNDDELVTLGAVKYAFLKQRTGGDIIYDPKESVSVEGNSGPYLQYAHARARSILRKAAGGPDVPDVVLEPGERSLARKISEYPEVVDAAVRDLMPHLVCTYLYELAQAFNRFYEKNRVIGDPREAVRLQLVQAYAQVLKNGLSLLNIPAPDKM